MSTDVRLHYRELFARHQAHLAGAGAPWIAAWRRRALDRFEELGLPTTRQEDWKYTSVAAVEKRHFGLAAGSGDGIGPEHLASLALPGSHLLVFVNGHYAPELSHPAPLTPGAEIRNLARVAEHDPERLEGWFAERTIPAANGFAALNGALWTDGAWIDVAAGITVEPPVHLLFIATEANLASCAHNLIRLAPGARVDVVEHHVGIVDASYLTNAMTRAELGPGAVLGYSKLQQENGHGFHVAAMHAEQAEHSRLVAESFSFGAALSRSEIATRFGGEGCEAALIGLYIADGRQHVDHHTGIDHASPGGLSRELYKGVLDDAARAVFNGRVVVRTDAQRSDAQVANHNLLLSDKAEVDTKPQLEIYADDVKCSHGATIGRLDDEHIFYLRSRGVDAVAARAMLIYAFCEDLLGRIAGTALRQRLRQLLLRRLPMDLRALP